MAVRIPIITVFDSKGLKAAQYQLNKVRGNFQNLGRNITIAGAALGTFGIGLAQSVKVASNLSESINAVNVSFGKSAKGILDFGKTAATTLGVSSLDFNNAAVRFSAFAERIVGSGQDATGFIRDITTRASDFASVFNIDVSEALQVFQSGLAGEAEPLKRFGVNLLDTEVKAYAVRAEIIKQGETLTEQQKVLARYGLLMESTAKTAGDFANTSSGLANASRILEAQMVTLQGEIGNALLPAIEQLMPIVQELTIEFGSKLKTAVASIDWASLLKSVSDLVIFFVQNLDAILKTVTALYLLNTAYNVIKITAGLANAVMALGAIGIGGVGTAAAGATRLLLLFRGALMLSGIGAVILALGFVVTGIMNGGKAAANATPQLTNYGGALRNSGKDAEWAAAKYGIATTAAQNLGAAAANLPIPGRTAATSRPSKGGARARVAVVVPNVSSQMKKTNSALDAAAKKAKAAAAKKKAAVKAAAAEEAAAAAAAAAARAERLRKEKEQYKSFGDSVASTFAGIKDKILDAFSLPELGGSTNSIIRNMGKLLAKTRDFSKNITQLSAMGLNPALLQQVISSGPVAGAQLAASLVAGGAAGLSTINAGYAELGTLASDIGMTGTQSLFGTQAQQNIYNINVRGGLDRAPDIGKAIVDAIRAYERTSGAVWQSA